MEIPTHTTANLTDLSISWRLFYAAGWNVGLTVGSVRLVGSVVVGMFLVLLFLSSSLVSCSLGYQYQRTFLLAGSSVGWVFSNVVTVLYRRAARSWPVNWIRKIEWFIFYARRWTIQSGCMRFLFTPVFGEVDIVTSHRSSSVSWKLESKLRLLAYDLNFVINGPASDALTLQKWERERERETAHWMD